jgi:DNA-binding FadR family transcriptional regulator
MLERKFSLELLIEFTQIRRSVEPGAAALAATAAGPAERAEIAHALERMVAAEKGEDDPLSADIAFHVAVLRASGNRFFLQMSEMIETALRISIRTTNDVKGRLASIADHKGVADAILAGQSARAEAKMRALIEGALDLILKVKAKKAAGRKQAR